VRAGNWIKQGVPIASRVARNVYVGVKQTLAGATQAQVQYDITRSLKAQATVSTVTTSTVTQYSNAVQDNGSSIGLSYQIEY
jgi:autotransporter translocation and assembly factor TamB